MVSSIPATQRPPCSPGRGFASMDPERQREVVGYVGSAPIATAAPARALPQPPAGSARPDWMCVLAEGDSFEGSSSRRGG